MNDGDKRKRNIWLHGKNKYWGEKEEKKAHKKAWEEINARQPWLNSMRKNKTVFTVLAAAAVTTLNTFTPITVITTTIPITTSATTTPFLMPYQ